MSFVIDSRKEIQQSSIGSSQVIGTVWVGHEIPSETDLCFASSEIHVCSCIFGNCTFAIKIIPLSTNINCDTKIHV